MSIPPRARWAMQEAAEAYGVTVADILGRSIVRRVSRARFAAMARVRELKSPDGSPAFSYPQIGRLFNRDHTSVIVGVRRAEELGLSIGCQYLLPLPCLLVRALEQASV